VRARRRAVELREAGNRLDEAEVLADIQRRDERDTKRAVAPLKAAPEAHLLDTTHLDIDAALRAAIDIVEAVRAGRKRGRPGCRQSRTSLLRPLLWWRTEIKSSF